MIGDMNMERRRKLNVHCFSVAEIRAGTLLFSSLLLILAAVTRFPDTDAIMLREKQKTGNLFKFFFAAITRKSDKMFRRKAMVVVMLREYSMMSLSLKLLAQGNYS